MILAEVWGYGKRGAIYLRPLNACSVKQRGTKFDQGRIGPGRAMLPGYIKFPGARDDEAVR